METRRALLSRAALGLGVLACDRAFGQPPSLASRGAPGRSSAEPLGQPAERAAYVGIETSAAGFSRARFLSGGGETLGTVPLDFRAHGMADHDGLMAVFPRRPGDRFALVDRSSLEIRDVVEAPTGRHFYGHGAFSADGRTLLVTENDLDTLGGAVGVYEIGAHRSGRGVRRLGTVALPGPGPHDIQRVKEPGQDGPSGRDRFQVALGGLMTHPDYGRLPLNPRDFTSQIVTLDLARGATEPMGPWPGTGGVSLRHLAADGAGRLYVGGQRVDVGGQRIGGQRIGGQRVEGRGVDPRRATTGGVLWLVEGGAAHPLDPDDRLGGYVSSVAARNGEALVTGKKAGLALRFEGARVVEARRIDGASAAALGEAETGTGKARPRAVVSGYATLHLGDTKVDAPPAHEFDNHGLALR